MNSKTYFIGDHHLGHKNILKFREFEKFNSVDDHDNFLITKHNEIVTNEDTVYFMGDFAFNLNALDKARLFNGRKKLLCLGNHDNRSATRYEKHFNKCFASEKLSTDTLITHIPVHECEFTYRIDFNIHAHHHYRLFGLDERYICTSLDLSEGIPLTLEQWRDVNHRIKSKS